jgi:hypothetical protein
MYKYFPTFVAGTLQLTYNNILLFYVKNNEGWLAKWIKACTLEG